ncbi:MAG TPA: AAA family ATPase [Sedimentisphaerales bacterium]|nr:AAA family ATPase [Sedimentisphaerales bacterium]HRS13074.1 AAA family ATPase [Sedimentisphaerales bacterium]HRV49652.1 AAA family ATPase [Sedimentisphaerales bacterium]
MGRSAKKSDRDDAKPRVLPQPYPYHDARNPVLLSDVVEGLLSGRRIFLSGGAGTGKTTLVRRIANQLVQRSKHVVLAASTGIAACQLRDETGIHNSRYCQGPSTLHAVASLPRVEMPDSRRRREWGRRKLQRAHVVVVDEISMVDRVTFDRFLERVEPETGILVVGDFFQLPPVPRNEEGLPDFAFYSTSFADFELIDLQTVLRQAEPHFIEFLKDLRHGRVDAAVLERTQREFDPDYPVLFGTNRQADAHNQRRIDQIDAPSSYSVCQVRKGDREEAVQWLQSHTRAKATLQIKKQMRVLCIQNHEDLVNGDLGTVVDICTEYEPGTEMPYWIDVEFDRNGLGTRRLNPLEFQELVWNSRKDKEEVKFTVAQYPIVPAYALTVHKAQGMTLDVVNIDGSHVNFVPGHVYVALSRARTLDGVRLRNARGLAAFHDSAVRHYYERACRFQGRS